ncbi:MAG: hypothetical protein M0015_17535 [Betaproteobacteria bacterium]|nr:hypothetical protein [Betaproteobacteria bacterium]
MPQHKNAAKLLLSALLAAAPLLAAAAPKPWSCRTEVLTHISPDGSRIGTAKGESFAVSDRGEFRLRVLDWIRGDDVSVCRREVNGHAFYTLSDGGRRVPASLLRGMF